MNKRQCRNISVGGHVLTIALEALRYADGRRVISLTWSPTPPKRLTVETAEALLVSIAEIKRELLSAAGST